MKGYLRLLGLIVIVAEVKIINGFPKACSAGQVTRLSLSGDYICCNTVICQQAQKYDFCDNHNGHDTCRNCPESTYHLDIINTAEMTNIIDPCIPKPTCEQPEVILEKDACVCDRRRGYYGSDYNNCLLSHVSCSSPGFELKNNGKFRGNVDHVLKAFSNRKLAMNTYVGRKQCKCFGSQEIADNGSTAKDISCKARKKVNLQDIKPLEQLTENAGKNITLTYEEFIFLRSRVTKLEQQLTELEEKSKAAIIRYPKVKKK
ncbi:uncharacterized protein LOC134692494 [Mytilus trossulus]|uniref:uncharacterized protein LOC134692494 n=1 Tax=Mytilus trossulus TaxID=6551 RepID=UPI003004ED9F